MAYTLIDVNDLLPGEPFTSAKALAFYLNPASLAAQEANSPKIADKFLTETHAGLGALTFSSLDDFGGIEIDATAERSGNDISFSISYSEDSGATFSTPTLVANGILTGSNIRLFVDFATGNFQALVSGGSFQLATGTVSGMTVDVTDIRLESNVGVAEVFVGMARPQGGASAV